MAIKQLNIKKIIEKGGSVKADSLVRDEWKMINLRISFDMLADVDNAVSNQVGITRTGWILQAIDEKLKS